MTCRGSRFNPTLTTPGKNSSEWEAQNVKSSRNFIRKWGHFVKHDEHMKPIIPHKYNIGFVVKGCNLQVLQALEPWCSNIYIEDSMGVIETNYIKLEQPHTLFNLKDRIKLIGYNTPSNDIIVEFEANKLTQESFNILTQLSEIITESGEVGTFELDIFKITIEYMNTLEHTLINIYNK
jgi:hypothetical protein